MDTLRTPLIDPGAADVREQLDRLASWVADRLEHGDDATAWDVTVATEVASGRTPGDGPRPPAPVIGRRFAAAHRRLLTAAARPPQAGRATAA